MTRPTILVTGFEPFGPHVSNPSADVAKALDGMDVGGVTVRADVLPVHHAEAAARVARLVIEAAPLAVVHVGLAAGRARVAIERVAVNVMDFEQPDATGWQARGEPCVADGPAAYFSTLPIARIVTALTADGIPAYVSNTAGTYLCNQTLYTTLHLIATRGLATHAGFVHVPLSSAMVAASGLEQPSMDVALMIRALETTLRVAGDQAR